jgi:hypothetical protein
MAESKIPKKDREEIEEFLDETRKLWRASQCRRRVYYDGRIDSLEWVLRIGGGAR